MWGIEDLWTTLGSVDWYRHTGQQAVTTCSNQEYTYTVAQQACSLELFQEILPLVHKAEFSVSTLFIFETKQFFVVGLCIAGCLAAPLASTH